MYRQFGWMAVLAGIGLLGSSPAANATFIYPTAGSNIGGGGAFFPVSNLFIAGDITPAATGTHPMNLDASTQSWVTTDNGSDYFAAGTAPILRFTLSSATALDAIYLWPYGGGTGSSTFQGNSAKTFNLTYRDAGLSSLGTVTGLTINPPFFPGSAAPRQTIAISAPALTAFVDMTITDNYFGEPGSAGGDRVGLGQVAFNAVPEPTGLTLFILGTIGMLRMVRRRIK